MKRHTEQRRRHLLAGGNERIHFSRRWLVQNLSSQGDETVGFSGHSGYDHDDLMAVALKTRHPFSYVLEPLDGPHGGAAVFLNNQCHRRISRSANLPLKSGREP